MITNHGVHEWQVTPGLQDTGGQNVYVNHFAEALMGLGYRVTIVNRGGYPHPTTGRLQTGTSDHSSGQGRILYLEDGTAAFVRKEDMHEQLDQLAESLVQHVEAEPDGYDLLVSHYWDGGMLGRQLARHGHADIPHVWVPHSVGTLKRRNVDPAGWDDLRLDERIAREHEIVASADVVVATSAAIRDALHHDYHRQESLFLPPCVDPDRFRPRSAEECADLGDVLVTRSGRPAKAVPDMRLVLEISRTDATKRKDVLIKAFARVCETTPNAVLAVAIDERAPLHDELLALIDTLHLTDNVVVLGSVWEHLPCLYTAADVYCTPSVMEGFGMSAQEAAACRTPVIASDLVPFVSEYLLGPSPVPAGADPVVTLGDGAVVVPADSVEGFANALRMLLSDEPLRQRMGQAARKITVPYFTWEERTRDLLDRIPLTGEPPRADG